MIRIKDTKKVQLNSSDRSAVALGKFDGIHEGHMLLVNKVLELQKEGYTGILFTFDMKENHVFDISNMKSIYTSDEKAMVAADTGIDVMVEYPFDDAFASTEPQAFIRDILVDMLHASYIVVGSDFRFGRDAAGDVHLLRKYSKDYGYKVIEIPKLSREALCNTEAASNVHLPNKELGIISSTEIRRCISEGQVDDVITLLGRPYSMFGKVVHGRQLGRTIGIPTANMLPDAHKLYPPAGVYASRIRILSGDVAAHEDPYRVYMGITNIGDNPTVNDTGCITIETNLFDFDRDIYGADIRVELISRIRGEKKFESVEELTLQMKKDIEEAKAILVK